MAGVVIGGLLVGCQTQSSSAQSAIGSSESSPTQSNAPTSQPAGETLSVAGLPEGLKASVVAPLTAAQRERAMLTLDEILEATPRPSFLPDDPKAAAEEYQPTEPPPAALRFYIRAREAWAQRRWFEARQQLERALKLSPGNPHLLELLARTWLISGNYTRSSQYLRQVLKAEPLNLDIALQLGQLGLDQGQYGEAIWIFTYIQKHIALAQEADPAIGSLASYYLAAALQRGGYAQSTIEAFEQFFALPPVGTHHPRHARQLMIIQRQRGLFHMELGDIHCRMEQFEKALQAYQKAQAQEVPDRAALIRRLLYVCVKLDQTDIAQKALMQWVADSDNENRHDAIELIRFLADHTDNPEQFINRLRKTWQGQPLDSQTAILIANLSDEAQGKVFIEKYLQDHRHDLDAFKWLIKNINPNQTDTQLKEAVKQTLDMMVQNPNHSGRYSVLLVAAMTDQKNLDKLLRDWPLDAPQTSATYKAAVFFLHAQSRARASDTAEAQALLEKALATDPDFLSARLRLAILFASRRAYDKVDKLLEPVKDSNDSRVVSLRVRVLSQTNRVDEALALFDRMIGSQKIEVPLILQKSSLQLKLRRMADAERTLLDALTVFPNAEAIYETLFELYDHQAVPDSMEQYKRLMWRMLGNIPRSRVARLRLAEAHAAAGDVDKAEKLLLELLSENEKDYHAIGQLLEMYRRAGRQPKADVLIEKSLAKTPDDIPLLAIAQVYYDKTGQKKKWFNVTRRFIELSHQGSIQSLQLGLLYLQNKEPLEASKHLEAAWEQLDGQENLVLPLANALSRAYMELDRKGEVDAVFEKARKLAPAKDADLRYYHAQTVQRMGESKRSEHLLAQLLVDHPDHAPANNGLGYTWATQSKNLQKAKQMIEIALKADPDSAAYLDSLGWVYYKLGQFEQAIKYLKQAMAAEGGDYPVILDHLGDALRGADQSNEAIRFWRRALLRLSQLPEGSEEDPELAGLKEKLTQKIQDASPPESR